MKDRKILLDTETTGLNYFDNDKIIEIACLELIDDHISGEKFHVYINPQMVIPQESIKIHGITNEQVKDSPIFSEIADDFINFIGDSIMIAHNASFDKNFINSELSKINKNIYNTNQFIDTLFLAKKLFPKQKNTLDALCDRFTIDRSSRKDYHGAFIDILLLKEVYINLIEGQKDIFDHMNNINNSISNIEYNSDFTYRVFDLDDQNLEKHNLLMSKIKNNIYN